MVVVEKREKGREREREDTFSPYSRSRDPLSDGNARECTSVHVGNTYRNVRKSILNERDPFGQ